MLTRYDGSPAHDLVLGQWWSLLAQRGELYAILPARYEALGAFLGFFRGSGTRVYFTADAGGAPDLVLFGVPWCDAAMLGVWVAPRRRRTRWAVERVTAGLRDLLAWSPLLMVLAPDEPRKRLYAKLGVRFLDGWVPGLWNGQPAALGWLTAMTWRPPGQLFGVAAADPGGLQVVGTGADHGRG